MSKQVYYRQCHLSKPTKAGTWEQTSWIPEKYAVAGKVLKLRDSAGRWDDGWVVSRAGANRVAENLITDYHDAIKGHRKSTGDALPKQ